MDRARAPWYKDAFSLRARGAAWLAHWTVNPEVAGSSPVEPANLVERKQGVGGSARQPLAHVCVRTVFDGAAPPARIPWGKHVLPALCEVSQGRHIRRALVPVPRAPQSDDADVVLGPVDHKAADVPPARDAQVPRQRAPRGVYRDAAISSPGSGLLENRKLSVIILRRSLVSLLPRRRGLGGICGFIYSGISIRKRSKCE